SDARAAETARGAIRDDVARLEPTALTLLRALIQTPSVTGDEGAHDDPATVAGLLWDSLDRAGVERRADAVLPRRDNIIAVAPGDPAGGVFVLDAHTDTVPPGAPTQWRGGDPYSAADGEVRYLGDDRVRLTVGELVVERPIRRRLGRLWEARSFQSAPVIYGRGSFDNKGPVAVAWLATVALAAALRRAGLRLRGTLVCGFTIDEEQHMAGVRALAGGAGSWLDRAGFFPAAVGPDGWRRGIAGVALDGSYGFVPVVGHRGIAQMLVRAHGQAAHAATPALGVNAVVRMAAALDALGRDPAALAAELAPLFADDVLEPVTAAIGTTIVGGGVRGVSLDDGRRVVDRAGINVVPDWCEATIDCRHPRPADGDQATIQQRIATTMRAYARARTGLPADAFDIELLGGGPPCAIIDRVADGARDPLVGAILRHGAAVSGFEPWVETAPGGTDATVMINEGQIRTLVEFGPAGAFAHEPHEFVERDQIAIGAEILARTVVDLLGVAPA
ncbi:MAG TPA: M20/M25/M40 family metallo-hydrolase, partial [Thermomicrobiales bacterium]|nr:M20/M25/M40 family metallo-hydrolase [Thermomicrobiales bacterium]